MVEEGLLALARESDDGVKGSAEGIGRSRSRRLR